MATYTDGVGFDLNTAAYSDRGLHKVTVNSVVLDFAAIIAARAAAGATALAATDVLTVLHIPAETILLGAGIEVTTVESTNTTAVFHVGDGADPDGYVASQASNALGSDASSGALGFGKYYAAADTLDLSLITAAPTDAVIRVFAVMANVSD
ncbi:hypothetical protein [uncultured Paraglaciecola sp.]|mgnify:CR=1 FL=1|uniref:hypothetical protein n=1 Tax=uncultured Paraglaciecola sp. TaxID=1765024 RepID=UPI0026307F6D|nr:hypothetical protein [uncultured Paraglaciecola sp.]